MVLQEVLSLTKLISVILAWWAFKADLLSGYAME